MSGRGRSTGRGTGRGGGGSYNNGGRGAGGREGGRGSNNYQGGGRGGGNQGGRGRGSGGRSDGGGGRGGRGPSLIANNPKQATVNLIFASVSKKFHFFLYGVACVDKAGKSVDSNIRRKELFWKGLMDSDILKNEDKDDWKRSIFFEGSYLLSSRPIPGLEAKNLPLCLVGGSTEAVESDNGDCFTIENVQPYTAPKELGAVPKGATPAPIKVIASPWGKPAKKKKAPTPTPPPPADSLSVEFDLRCSMCTKAFATQDGLLSHCKNSNHTPQYGNQDATTKPANREVFLTFCNAALSRALGERMKRWGRDYIDPDSITEPKDYKGNSLGVNVFKAYKCDFGLHRKGNGPLQLGLTVDLGAKLMRTTTLLDTIYQGKDRNRSANFSPQEQNALKRSWVGEVVICTYDRKCYSVVDILFDKSPASLPVEGLNMSHAEYFEKRKSIKLKHPNSKPMIGVLGRSKSTIYLPAEVVCGNELEPNLKMMLPMIASFTPEERHVAMDKVRRFLVPGAQKTKGIGGGLLPALGIQLQEERLVVPVSVLPLPMIVAAGVQVPANRGGMWAPLMSTANFKVTPGRAVELKVILIVHQSLERAANEVYGRIRGMVNNFNSTYRFGDSPHAIIKAGDNERHWGAVRTYFDGSKVPANVFVIDLTKPPRRQALDPAYSVVKQMLGNSGFLSQFVNFNTCDHSYLRDDRAEKKSSTILSGVARQVLSKCGVRVWWVNIPRTLPLPAVFVGVDVFHAPRKYDAITKKKTAKASCAAIIVQLVRSTGQNSSSMVEIYSKTFKRGMGQETELGDPLKEAIGNAIKYWKVTPKSCVIWRDGVGDNMIKDVAKQEIPSIRSALQNNGPVGTASQSKSPPVPLAYVVCQKRIATKFLSADGKQGMPAGTLVSAIQGPDYPLFYINGTSPSYSTPKPVRFVVAERDAALYSTSMSELTWALCHDYPNWTGPIKLPGPTQCAHKLAELAGGFADCGEGIDDKAYLNKIYFL